ncbi:MAG: hypothetical protein N2691_04990 [Patescibacteria group bacterium]|nr:hypothetical protein [Patescibacteria group bacterium]
MRIGFLGKGGSGKTTIAAGFIKYLAAKGLKPILAIDADVNVHLATTLALPNPAHPIGHDFSAVAEYVRGSRTDLKNTSIVATTPPSLASRFIRLTENDPFLSRYASKNGSVCLLTIGTYRSCDVGHTCYHGKLNTLELIYHHLLDTDSDMVVADATAGIDNLGTSLFFAYDLNVFVVEPTRKSIDVFLEFERVSHSYGLNTRVVINKTEDDADIKFIKQHIPEEKIIAIVPRSKAIRHLEQGNKQALELFVLENKTTFEAIRKTATSSAKDWEHYYKLLLETHKKNSIEWWDAYYGQPISTQFDPDFSYSKVL